ncbi:MAG TPA: cyclase, partial [bacterium]|nr:cyclase [bacterium]
MARPSEGEDRLAKGLGWLSVALGVTQLMAPRQVSRLIGIADTGRNRAVMRAVGVRELGAAAGILDRPRPAGFLFGRVAGDAMDLLLLGAAYRA